MFGKKQKKEDSKNDEKTVENV